MRQKGQALALRVAAKAPCGSDTAYDGVPAMRKTSLPLLASLFALTLSSSAIANPTKKTAFAPEPLPPALKQALIELVNINSGTKNPAGNELSRQKLIPLFTHLGFVPRIVDTPPLAAGEANRRTLVLEFPNAKPDILFLGHVDTVFETSSPFQKFTETQTAWRGPGVADMKGNLVMLAHMLSTLKEKNEASLRRIRIAINDDEEAGSTSSGTLLKELASQAKYGLILEPVTDGSDLTPSHSGVVGLEMVSTGRAAAAGYPEKGVNACLELAHKMIAVQSFMRFASGLYVNTGVIGSEPYAKRNMVCDKATAKVDVRYIHNSDLQTIRREIEGATEKPSVCNLAGSECAKTTVTEMLHAPALTADRTKLLLELYRKTAAEQGEKITAKHKGGVDAYGIMDTEIELLSGLGLHGGGYHSTDEHVLSAAYPRKFLLNLAFLDALLKR